MENLSYGFWVLGVVTAAYMFIAGDLAYRDNYAMSFVFLGYSLANLGMMVAIK